MKLEITFRGFEHTEALDGKIREKVKKLNKYLSDGATVHWTSFLEKDAHKSDVLIHEKGKDYFASSTKDSLYQTIDEVISKLEHQLAHHKKDQKFHRQTS